MNLIECGYIIPHLLNAEIDHMIFLYDTLTVIYNSFLF